MPPPRNRSVPSAARPLSAVEADQIVDTVKGLPESWVLAIEAPWGQLTIVPRAERRVHVACWVGDPVLRKIHRDRWRPPA